MCPVYDYKAVSTTGKAQKGIVEAENQKAARLKLKKQGLLATDISEKQSQNSNSKQISLPGVSGRISVQHIALMTRQLASLVKANISLVESLTALIEQVENDSLKVILSQVRQDVNEGISLSKAMSKHPKAFDHLFIHMIEAGESSGALGLVLLRLAELKEAQMRLRSKVISGMTYPILMMVVAFVLVIALFTFVIPKLTGILVSSKKAIPISTKIVMGISSIFVNYWYLLLAGFVLILILFLRFIKTESGRMKWDRFKLHLPLLGGLIRMIAVTRFSTTMSTLLSSGVPILNSLNIAKNLVGNVCIELAVSNARENITEGQSIADPLKKSGEFPPIAIHMIAIGEKTGELPQMLQTVANTFEEQVNSRIDRLVSLLEPIMIVFMGVIVGFIVLSVFLPMLEISSIR